MAEGKTSTAAAANGGGDFDFALYRYDLSLPAAVTAVAVFTILTVAHVWRLRHHRAYYFIPFTIGGVFEIIGYSGRIWSHFSPTALGGFIMQAILILVAPALFAASIYMILGRLVLALRAERHSLIPTRYLTKLFVVGDVFSFLLQAGGGGVQSAGSLEMYEVGEKVIIAGLFAQIAMFGFFLVTAVVFHVRQARGGGRHDGHTDGDGAASPPWRRHLTVLYVVSAVIMVRSVFRVVEYLQGNGGYLISHEVFLYVFDAVLMAVVMAVFLVFYVDDLNRDALGAKRGSAREMLSSSEEGRGFEMSKRPAHDT